jgi:hypothetical protein
LFSSNLRVLPLNEVFNAHHPFFSLTPLPMPHVSLAI